MFHKLLLTLCLIQASSLGSETYTLEVSEQSDFTVVSVTGRLVPPLADQFSKVVAEIPKGRRIVVDLDNG